MTITDINSYVNFRLNTDTTQFSDANRLLVANRWYHKIVTMILASQDEWDWDDSNATDYPTATTPLVASRRDYTFPASLKILKIKRVDVTYDGTNYYQARPIDVSEFNFGNGNDDKVDQNFDKQSPAYDPKSNSIWLYPRANAADVSAGGLVKIEFLREPAEFTLSDVTTGSKEPGFDEPFHIMIALGMCWDFASAKQLPMKNDIWAELQDYEAKIKQYYGNKQTDREYNIMGDIPNFK